MKSHCNPDLKFIFQYLWNTGDTSFSQHYRLYVFALKHLRVFWKQSLTETPHNRWSGVIFEVVQHVHEGGQSDIRYIPYHRSFEIMTCLFSYFDRRLTDRKCRKENRAVLFLKEQKYVNLTTSHMFRIENWLNGKFKLKAESHLGVGPFLLIGVTTHFDK